VSDALPCSDFDPSAIPRRKKPKDQQITVNEFKILWYITVFAPLRFMQRDLGFSAGWLRAKVISGALFASLLPS
jgi:hypothetical protein